MNSRPQLSLSLDWLNRCLLDRAIRAESVEDYRAISDMAHGASLMIQSNSPEAQHLRDISTAVEDLMDDLLAGRRAATR